MTLDAEQLNQIPAASCFAGKRRLLVDVSDLVETCISGLGLTGIQRVQACIAIGLMANSAEQSFVMVDPIYNRLWLIDVEGLMTMIVSTADEANRLSRRTDVLGQQLFDAACLILVAPGDVLINLGAFWNARYTSKFVRDLAKTGCAYIPLIYDLLAFELPELCEVETARSFDEALPRALSDATALLTVSRAVETAIRSYTAAKKIIQLPIRIVPLAHQMPSWGNYTSNGDDTPNSWRGLDEPFVLSVGTFEPRKNQLRLAKVWATLAADIKDLPVLALVGKIGWLSADDFLKLDQLVQTSCKIALLHEVSDVQLADLYRRCLFTVFVPISEGWGLPVGESLASNKVCVASSGGGIPEVAGAFPIYVDPYDLEAIAAVLRKLVSDPTCRREFEENIKINFRSRVWSDVVRDLLQAVAELSGTETSLARAEPVVDMR